MAPLTMLDLCSGLHGASAAMRERGWRVISVDCLEWTKPSLVADVCHLPLCPFQVDLIWASPACKEYSRYDQPWFPKVAPDLSLYLAARAIITAWHPRFYVIENVRGAQRWWGKATIHYSSRYLWTDLPFLPQVQLGKRLKRSIWGGDPHAYWKRSKIEYPLSLAIAEIVETLS